MLAKLVFIFLNYNIKFYFMYMPISHLKLLNNYFSIPYCAFRNHIPYYQFDYYYFVETYKINPFNIFNMNKNIVLFCKCLLIGS